MSSSRSTSFQWKQWIAALAASSVMIGDEMDVVWFSLNKHVLSKLELVLEAVLMIIGAIAGAVIADIYGRRGALLGSLIFAIPRMAVLYLTAELTIGIETLILSFASGFTCVVVPLYISEIANADNRGNLMLTQLSAYSFGRFAWILYGDPEAVKFWRCSIFAASISLHAITIWLFPETPQYLNWEERHQETVKSLTFFRGNDQVRLTQDPTNLSTTSAINDKKKVWHERIREISGLDNRRNLAIIFSLIAIRQTSGQEWNSFAVYIMALQLNTEKFHFIELASLCAATFVFCVFVMLTIEVFARKLSLLLVIFASFVWTVIGTIILAHDYWVLFGVLFSRYLAHIIFIGTTLAYVGKFFPINARAVAIAAVISCEVLTRNGLFLIERLIDGTAASSSGYYVPPQSYSNYGAFLAAFFLVLIFFPKTNKLPSDEIAVETSVDGTSSLLE